MTQTEIDVRIGRRRGYLSHVFQRRVDLKVEDLLLSLEALGIDPPTFFEAACEPANSGAAPLLRLVTALPQSKPIPDQEMDQAILEERVRKALRSILGQISTPEERSGLLARG